MSIIMAILIVVSLGVIVVTIYGRLNATEKKNIEPLYSTITLPDGARVRSAGLGQNGQIILVVEHNNRLHIQHFDGSGRLYRQIQILTSTP